MFIHTSRINQPLISLFSDNAYYRGNRYVRDGNITVMLLFDENDKIAGIQTGVSIFRFICFILNVLLIISLRKQPTFYDATTCFPPK